MKKKADGRERMERVKKKMRELDSLRRNAEHERKGARGKYAKAISVWDERISALEKEAIALLRPLSRKELKQLSVLSVEP